jgi:hypothetical protein
MNNKLVVVLALTLLAAFNSQPTTAFAQGTAFTYQGRLNSGGSPAGGLYDFRFKLYADPLGDTQAGATYLAATNVPVANGLFVTTMDFGAGIFTGSNYWLEVAVRTNLAVSYTVLSPLQELTPTPYAVFANTASNVSGSVSSAQVSGTIPAAQINGRLTSANLPVSPSIAGTVTAGGGFVGDGSNVTNVNAATVGGLGAAYFWQLGGNNVAAGQFLGSTNNQAVEIRVNGGRALRLESGTSSQASAAPNVIGGSPANYVASGVGGATIGGGGATNYLSNGGLGYTNVVLGDFGTVGGGASNAASYYSAVGGGLLNYANSLATVGGGRDNLASDNTGEGFETVGGGDNNTAGRGYATVGGGLDNTAGGIYSTVGGGGINQATGKFATVGGGFLNLASGQSAYVGGGGSDGVHLTGNTATGVGSVVSGGSNNNATNSYATVPGGANNLAGGQYSFAAGYNAQATNQGAFVWADSQGTTFGSSANNQFNVRANGGAQFVTGGAGMTLDGNPVLTNNQTGVTLGGTFNGNGGGLTSLNAAQLTGSVPGATLTVVPAANLTGSISLARLPSQVLTNNQTGPVNLAGTVTVTNGFTVNTGLGTVQFVMDTFVPGLIAGNSGGNSGHLRFRNALEVWPDTGGANSGYVDVRNTGGSQTITLTGSTGAITCSNVTANGVLLTSDRNAKENFTAPDTKTLLAKVAAMPVMQWNYKTDSGAVQHIGPMAQDFHAAFGLDGADDRHISVVDEGGVALAAIQGLNQKLEEKDAEIQNLKARLDKLEQLLSEKK